MEIATAFVTIRPQTDGFAAEVAAAAEAVPDQTVTVGADTEEAQASIDSLDGGTADVEVGAETDEAQAAIDAIQGGDVTVEVGANTDEAQSQIDGLGDSVSGLLGDLGGSGGGGATGALDAFGGAALGAGNLSSIAATGGVAALAAGLGTAVSAASEAEVVGARLNAILDATGAGAYINATAVQSLATEIEHYSGQSDEAVQSAATLLLTFNGLSNQQAIQSGIFERSVKATADIAALMGGEASDSALKLGRALDDPVKGMGALQRSGISFTQAQKDVITSLAETGQTTEAQSALLDVVESQVGGVAAAYGETMAGSVDKAKQSIDDASETIGATMLPALAELATWVASTADEFQTLDDIVGGALTSGPIQAIFGGGDAAKRVGTDVAKLGGDYMTAAAGADEFADSQVNVAEVLQGTAPTLGDVVTGIDKAGQAFGVLAVSSDPSVVAENLRTTVLQFQIFRQEISTIGQIAPNLAAQLAELGPQVGGPLAGSLLRAIQDGRLGVVGELEGLVSDVAGTGADVSGLLTGAASQGMAGAAGAIQQGTPGVSTAANAAGTAGASGLDAGLATSQAAVIGTATGINFGVNVAVAIANSAGGVSAAATNVVAGAGSTAAAYSRGFSLGSSLGSGIAAGLAAQRGVVAANRAALDAAAEAGAALGRGTGRGSATINITVAPRLDGRPIAEAVTEHQRIADIGLGYDQ